MMRTIIIVAIIVIILSIIEVFIFAGLKKYHDTKNKWYFLASIIGYVVVAALLVYSFNFQEIAVINGLWNALTLVLIALLGYFVFKERLNWKEIIAIILMLVAMLLLLCGGLSENRIPI